jgi:uncharacterized protein (TIGR02118 family)
MTMSDQSAWVRCIGLLTRQPGITRAEFNEHWRTVHAKVAAEYPHVIRYSQLHLSDDDTAALDHDYGVDGIVDFIFDRRENYEKIWATAAGQAGLADVPNFISTSQMYFVDELVILDKTDDGLSGS